MKNGWTKQKLGEIISLEYGKPLPNDRRDENGIYPAYGANGVKCRTNDSFWDTPSIIIGRKGSAGELNLVDAGFWPLDVTYYVTFDHEKCDLKFLYYMLSRLNLPSLAKGVKPGINRNDVYAIEQFIPPLPKQKRIVAILDEAFAGIATAVANTEKNLANARELFESYLNLVFARRGEGWVDVLIHQVCESITDCVNKTAPQVNSSTPFKMIRTTNVRNGSISLDSVKYVTEDVYRIWTRRQVPKKGDVVLTREAPMGEVGMLETDEKVFLGQRLVSYRTNPEKLSNRFLLYGFQSDYIQSQIRALASGSTVQHMRVPDSKKLRIPLPSLRLQKTISERLDILREETQQLEAIYEKKLTALAELKQSLLQKAFSGALTAEPEPLKEEEVA